MAHVNIAGATGAGLMGRINELRDVAVEKAAKRKVFRTTVRELQNLSDRELADLGIGRSEIRGIALESAYGN